MRILIADHHHWIAEGIRAKLLELGPETECAIALNADELWLAIKKYASCLNLILIDLIYMTSHNAVAKIYEHFPAAPIILLSDHEDSLMKSVLGECNVKGVIPKTYSPDILLAVVRLVLMGGTYMPSDILSKMGKASLSNPLLKKDEKLLSKEIYLDTLNASKKEQNGLTDRQYDVLRLLSQGKPNKSIAQELEISIGTVKVHLAAIYKTLNVHNRTAAVMALQQFF